MKLSIVIPVYNGAQHLDQIFRCLDQQSDSDYEAIFINDGSTDQTGSEFMRMRMKYPLVTARMYSQENRGVSAARNIGIQQITGDILTFCDVDDVLSPNYVEYILKSFQNMDVDLVFWRFIRCRISRLQSENVRTLRCFTLDKMETMKRFLTRTLISGCWSCAVRSTVVKNHAIFYEEDIKYGEDQNYLWKLLFISDSVGFIDNILYYYIIQPDSAMSKFDERRLEGYYAALRLTDLARERSPEFAPLYEKYEWARVLWSVAWQGAVRLNWDQFQEYFMDVPLTQAMQTLRDYPKKRVQITAKVYLRSPALFFHVMRFLGKNRCS